MRHTTLLLCLCLIFVIWVNADDSLQQIDLSARSQRAVRDPIYRCPANCNNRGTCTRGRCQCNPGYAGMDCSVLDDDLMPGNLVSGHVNLFQWHYYHIDLSSSDRLNLVVQVNQTKSVADCDVYIRRNDYPTRTRYDAKDVSSRRYVTLQLRSQNGGIFYIGMYGFYGCSYTIQAQVFECPNGCSGHGSCRNYQCICRSGYEGADCSVVVKQLERGKNYNGELQQNQWAYYYFNFSNTIHSFVLRADEKEQDGDLDLYALQDARPSRFENSYNNLSQIHGSTLTIFELHGFWYFGIFAFRGCNYTLNAGWEDGPVGCSYTKCSLHGTCSSLNCSCNPDFQGPSCENKTQDTQLDHTETGYVARSFWNYYSFSAPAQKNTEIFVNTTEGDCDLFIRESYQPTSKEFDYADASSAANFSLRIPASGISRWFIGLYGFSSCSYSLTISLERECCGGSPHGSCRPGTFECVCESGWTGPDCSISYTTISSNQMIQANVSKTEWKYYYITANHAQSLVVVAKETETAGKLSVFSQTMVIPSIFENDASDHLEDQKLHFNLITNPQADVFIGVLGPDDIPLNEVIPFQLVAYIAPFSQ